MPTEQTIDGETYRTGQLNAKEQFHVARRLAPIVASFSNQGSSGFIGALAMAVSKLPDDDIDYVMRVTMKTVTRKVADRWANVWNLAADQPQFSDMNASTLLQLVIAVVQDNLGSFTSGLAEVGPDQTSTAPNARLN